MKDPRILIAGVGNVFMGDDAFGVEVVQRLSRCDLPDCVKVADFGIRGIDLLYALLEDHELTILIDAAPRGGAPGTLYRIEPDLSDCETAGPPVLELHSMDLPKVFASVKSMGGSLPRLVLIGCEPEPLQDADGRLGLSAPVRAALADAVAMVETVVREHLATPAPNDANERNST